jgi:hypothetical protein
MRRDRGGGDMTEGREGRTEGRDGRKDKEETEMKRIG